MLYHKLALGLASLQVATACQSDTECSLNGVCVAGHCVCDAGWTGSDCGVLDLRKANRANGYNRTSEGISSWCSSIVHDPKNSGLYHLILSEFTHHCGLDYWSPYSRIVRAVSNSPDGPYTFAAEVQGSFAHNPTVVYDEAEEQYLIYHIGCPQNPPDVCTAPDFSCGPGNSINGESGISVLSSKDLIHWQPHEQVMKGADSDAWDADVTNPAPLPLSDPGSRPDDILLVYRGCGYNCSIGEYINIAMSTNGLNGPYQKLEKGPIFANESEDPFVWQDVRGNWHMLVHSLEPLGGFGSGPNVGRHTYARNLEGPWTFDSATLAFSTHVDFKDGTSIDFSRRERPNLYFSEDGRRTPLFLTTGVQETGSSQSYSIIVPIGDEGEKMSDH